MAPIREGHAAAGEIENLAAPEAEESAGEIRVIQNRIESVRLLAMRISITGAVEEGGAVSNPVLIERCLQSGHAGVDLNRPFCDGIVRIVAIGLIERVGHID